MQNNSSSSLLKEVILNEKSKITISEYRNPKLTPEEPNISTNMMAATTVKDMIKVSVQIELPSKALVNAISFGLQEQEDHEPGDGPFTFLEIEGYKSEESVYEKFIDQSNAAHKRNQSELLPQNHPDPTQKIYALGIAKILRVSLLVKRNFLQDQLLMSNMVNEKKPPLDPYSRNQIAGERPRKNPLEDLQNHPDKDSGNYDDEEELEYEGYEEEEDHHDRGWRREVHRNQRHHLGDKELQESLGEDDLEWKLIFIHYFSSVKIDGYSLYASPPASHVVSLLNVSNIFRKHNKTEELIETEILLSFALINARRFVQAAELLRKNSNLFVAQHDQVASQQQRLSRKMPSQQPPRSKTSKDPILSSTQNISSKQGSGSSKLLLRAAKLEIIFADAINQHSMSNEKISALQKAAEYSSGQRSAFNSVRISPSYDIYSVLLQLSPILCRFLTRCLNDKLEPLRAAAIRTLEYILEHLGCSVGSYLPNILKAVLLTYPSQNFMTLNSNREHMGMNDLDPLDAPLNIRSAAAKHKQKDDQERNKPKDFEEFSIKPGTEQGILPTANLKFYIDIYNHLLEDILNVITWASSQILHLIFQDILLPNIFLPDLGNDLKIYLFRLSEKIINICQGDLKIGISFYSNLLDMLESKSSAVRLSAQRLWEAVKAKIVFNLDNKALSKILEWVSDSLYMLAEDQSLPPENINHLNYLLDLLAVMCSREASNNNSGDALKKPIARVLTLQTPLNLNFAIKPLIVWLELVANTSGNTNNIDLFKNVWVVTVELLKITPKALDDGITIFEIAYPLLWKVYNYCQESSPTVYMLNFLIIILNAIREKNPEFSEFLKEFLSLFTECIPHSVFDESFMVFDHLINQLAGELPEDLVQKCIVALIDQFTMRGKAQKQSKKNFIAVLMDIPNSNIRNIRSSQFYNALKICLFDNLEPTEEDEILFSHTSELQTNTILLDQRKPDANIKKKNNHHNATAATFKKVDNKQFNKYYENFLEKLFFAQDIISQIREQQFAFLVYIVADGTLQYALEKLISSTNSKVRLICLDLLTLLTDAYSAYKDFGLSFTARESTGLLIEDPSTMHSAVPDFELSDDFTGRGYLTSLKIVFLRMSLNLLKLSFDTIQDPKLHNYSLSLLRRCFEEFLPSCEIQEELDRYQNKMNQRELLDEVSKVEIIDIENVSLNATLKLKASEIQYLYLRGAQILRFWPNVQNLSLSSWANIRTQAVSIFLMFVKPDLTVYKPSIQKKLKGLALPLLSSFLTSKEVDVRYTGLLILGALCGVNYNFEQLGSSLIEVLHYFRRLSDFVSLAVWENVFDLQKDWNTLNRDLATTLVQLAAPKESINHFYRLKKEGAALKLSSEKNQQQAFNESNQKFNLSNLSQFSMGGVDYQPIVTNKQQDDSALNISGMLKYTNLPNKLYDSPIDIKDHASKDQFYSLPKNSDRVLQSAGGRAKFFDDQSKMSLQQETERLSEHLEFDEQEIFWLEKASLETILEYLSLFKVDLKISPNYWLDNQTLSSADVSGKRPISAEALIEEQQEEYPADRYYYLENEEVAVGDLNPNSGNANRKGKPNFHEDNVDLDDLGIIELEEDEEWMEYADELVQKRANSNQSMPRSRTTQRSENLTGTNNKKIMTSTGNYYKSNQREVNEGSPTSFGHHQNYDYNHSLFDPSQRLVSPQFKELHQGNHNFGSGKVGSNEGSGGGFSPTRKYQNKIHVADDFTSTQKLATDIYEHQSDKMSNLREKTVLRPQNQLFRPLTPPVKNQAQRQPRAATNNGYDDSDEQEIESGGHDSRYQNNRRRHNSGNRTEATDQLYRQSYPSRSLKESHSSTKLEVVTGAASPKELMMANEADTSQLRVPFYDHSEPPETIPVNELNKNKSDPEMTIVKSPKNTNSSEIRVAADSEPKNDEIRSTDLKINKATQPIETLKDKENVNEKEKALEKKDNSKSEDQQRINQKASKSSQVQGKKHHNNDFSEAKGGTYKKERYSEENTDNYEEDHSDTKATHNLKPSDKHLATTKKENSTREQEAHKIEEDEGLSDPSPSPEPITRKKVDGLKPQRSRDPTPIEKPSKNTNKQPAFRQDVGNQSIQKTSGTSSSSKEKDKRKIENLSTTKDEIKSSQTHERQQQSNGPIPKKLTPEESKKLSLKQKVHNKSNDGGSFKFPDPSQAEEYFEESFGNDHAFENFELGPNRLNQLSKFTGSLSNIQKAVENSKQNSDRKEKSVQISSASRGKNNGQSSANTKSNLIAVSQFNPRGSPSSATKNKTMKNILKKAAKILKEEQTGLNEFLDKQEMILINTGIHIKDNLNLMDELLTSLQKEGKGPTKVGTYSGASPYNSETNKRSISAQKNTQNIPMKTQPLSQIPKGPTLLATIQPFMNKSPAYGRSPDSNRKNLREKNGKKLGNFIPSPSLAPKVQSVKGKYITPLRNNFLSQDDPSLLNKSDLNNQTL